jgi:hypothetical protein
VTYDYENELRSLSYLHHLFRSTSRAILEDSQFPLITKIKNDVQSQHHFCNLLPPDGHCQADEMGREALPGSTSGNQQVGPEATGGEDGGHWRQLGNLAPMAPFSRLRSRRVRRHHLAAAAPVAARLALAAARSVASRAAASATKAALKHGLNAAPRQVIPNAIKWGPQVAGRAGVDQATQTIGRAARRGARRAGATSGRVVGTAGQRSQQALTRTAEVVRQQQG